MSNSKFSSLPARVASALIALGALLAVAYYFGEVGLIVFSGIAIAGAIAEYRKISFNVHGLSRVNADMFLFLGLAYVSLSCKHALKQDVRIEFLLPAAVILMVLTVLATTRDKLKNEKVLLVAESGVLGLLYCVYFPSFIFPLLKLDFGMTWFFYLLLVVFSSDIAAYFAGSFFGKRKLMASISPKKTFAGAVGGLAASTITSVAVSLLFLNKLNPAQAIVLGLVVGVVAQAGDLLASLIKRVGEVKDSGIIMPGHGGFLDRADGVFLACPVVYFAATIL